ncbi:lysophosphatidic acid receptor 6-like [Austrofundulus limnaeus]|uniref:Lysophosphatidic acid receptor 6-like n=1 Tax=Austrofundulus limnaeus TaxID=52670 RepID=A0A2I4BRS7_AUSLI|nr:PREDICTED: lysophosphatidic acid receptor 6-like [Austrofundulus limnaeus]
MKNPVFALIYGSIIAIGLPLNAIALWILLRRHGSKSSSAVFMINLAISDLLLIISLFMRVHYYSSDTWQFGWLPCIWFTMLFRNNIRTSSIFITFISVDRLLAVVYPLRSRHLRTTSKAVRGAVFVWLVVHVVNVPEGFGFSKHLDNQTCFEFNTGNNSAINGTLRNSALADKLQLAIGYFQLVLLFTLLVVNILSMVMVSWTLHRHLNDSAKVDNKLNIKLIFATNLMMFIVFFLPVSLVVFFDNLRPVLSCLASVNCCLDPLLYYFSFDGFWKKKEGVEISLARD